MEKATADEKMGLFKRFTSKFSLKSKKAEEPTESTTMQMDTDIDPPENPPPRDGKP
ncbi:MAG: hypothetical protein ACE5HI_02360 [bacterium]